MCARLKRKCNLEYVYTQNIKFAVLYIDRNGNNHAGLLLNPIKVQTISKNQGLFTIEFDDTMKGLNPVTGKICYFNKNRLTGFIVFMFTFIINP